MKKLFTSPKLARLLIPGSIAAVFVYLAGKIAFVRQYPLPYDESFHVGIIRIYTHHLNPFLAQQPAGGDAYGALARDPSYLYHYLMSFPLRLISLFVHSTLGQVIALRSINIALGLWTLYLVYKLARYIGVPKLAAQLAAVGLAITPVFYDVASEVNYDNLLLPLTILTVLLALQLRQSVLAGRMPWARFGSLVATMLAASLVKYSFLPILAVVSLYVSWLLLRHVGIRQLVSSVRQIAVRSWSARVWAIGLAVAVLSVCWLQRYGVNMVLYHTPHPQCHVVLNVQECEQYGAWARNYQLHATAASRPIVFGHGLVFTKVWVRTMSLQLFSVLHLTPSGVTLVLLGKLRLCAQLIFIGAIVAALYGIRSLWRQRNTWLLCGLVAASYAAALWLQNASDYRNLHAFVAIQGRYLLPILPLAYIAIAASYVAAVRRLRTEAWLRLQPSAMQPKQQFARMYAALSAMHLL